MHTLSHVREHEETRISRLALDFQNPSVSIPYCAGAGHRSARFRFKESRALFRVRAAPRGPTQACGHARRRFVHQSTDPQSDVARARSWAAIYVQDFDAPCVLQFAWISALCCALHRSTSQVIHRSGSYIYIFVVRFLSLSPSQLSLFRKKRKEKAISDKLSYGEIVCKFLRVGHPDGRPARPNDEHNKLPATAFSNALPRTTTHTHSTRALGGGDNTRLYRHVCIPSVGERERFSRF